MKKRLRMNKQVNVSGLRQRVLMGVAGLLAVLSIVAPFSVSAQYAGQQTVAFKAPVKVPVTAFSFDLQDVRLLSGPFRDNMEREGSWLLSLPVERLLHSFRVNAGMLTDKKD